MPKSLESWLTCIHARFEANAPDLLPMLDVYANEATFGRRYLTEELQRLPPDACVLEVGAGSMILSCQLVREGYRVTALEPIGVGFSHFSKMRTLIMELAQSEGCLPEILDVPGEELFARRVYDLAFSINVMEHVDDAEKVISNIIESLKPGAKYRFTCPNYLFPYEPHFGIPTLFTKRLTEKVMRKSIFHAARKDDPTGLWNSLNWITVNQIRRHMRREKGCVTRFDGTLLASTLERTLSDPAFAARHAAMIRLVATVLVRLKVHRLLAKFPATCQPIIDCIITKETASEEEQWRK